MWIQSTREKLRKVLRHTEVQNIEYESYVLRRIHKGLLHIQKDKHK